MLAQVGVHLDNLCNDESTESQTPTSKPDFCLRHDIQEHDVLQAWKERLASKGPSESDSQIPSMSRAVSMCFPRRSAVIRGAGLGILTSADPG